MLGLWPSAQILYVRASLQMKGTSFRFQNLKKRRKADNTSMECTLGVVLSVLIQRTILPQPSFLIRNSHLLFFVSPSLSQGEVVRFTAPTVS